MKLGEHIVVFTLDESKYALYLSTVERVISSVAITPLPGAPSIVDGLIKIKNQILPVINLRRRFQLPEHEISLSDQIIIAKTSRRLYALVVDSVEGTLENNNLKIVSSDKILPSLRYVDGIVPAVNGLILIHNLENFLSLDEEKELEKSIMETMGTNGSERFT